MSDENKRESAFQDVGLILMLALFCALAILMAVSGNLLLNILYLFLTMGILIITYFFGLITSLLTNFLFIAVQVLIVVYQYTVQKADVHWELAFWMIMPLILSVITYFMTRNQIKLQESNGELRSALVERGAFDEETNLRTTVAYVEDAGVFVETHRRFELPVATVIIKIRYFDDLKHMMSSNQLQALLHLASETIKAETRNNDITYLLNVEDPTWAVLLYSDAAGAGIAANRVKAGFNKQLLENSLLADLAIYMIAGVVQWNDDTMTTPYDLIDAGVRETQYDV